MPRPRPIAVTAPWCLLSPACASFDQFANFEQRAKPSASSCSSSAMAAASGGRHDDLRPQRSQHPRPLVVDGRSLDLGCHRSPDRHRHDDEPGGEPAVATRIRLDSFSLVRHPLRAVADRDRDPACDLADERAHDPARRDPGLLSCSWGLAVLTIFMGQEIKGATRWLDIGGFSLQPSEFVKPCFAVAAAWMFSIQHGPDRIPGNLISILLYLTVVGVLMAQPDLGMTVVVSCTWFAQFFLAGLPLLWVGTLAGVGVVGLVGAYFTSRM